MYLDKAAVAVVAGLLSLVGSAWAVEDAAVLDSLRVRALRRDRFVKSVIIEREFTASAGTVEPVYQTIFIAGVSARLETRTARHEPPTVVAIRHARETWEMRPHKPPNELSRRDYELQQLRWDWWSVIMDSAALVGPDVVDGAKCWQLSCGDQSGFRAVRYWLDQRTLDCIKGECTDKRGLRLRWKHADFRELTAGIRIPFSTQIFERGSRASTARLTGVELNPEFAPELFDASKVVFEPARPPRHRGRRSAG